MTLKEAMTYREAITQAAVSLDDKTASETPALFKALTGTGQLVAAGTRINWNGGIKKAAVDLWDTTENDPDHAPNLWADLDYFGGYRVIPERAMTAAEAFSAGEIGYQRSDETYYKALADGTVWPPSIVPSSWEVV